VRAVTTDNPQHGAIRAVTRIAVAAQVATTAAGVDLADDSSARCRQAVCRLCHLLNHANKFMAQRTFKTGIPARDLKIGIANTRERYAHENLAADFRLWHIGHAQLLLFVSKSLHKQKSDVRGQKSFVAVRVNSWIDPGLFKK
jgi:hypothetical protein